MPSKKHQSAIESNNTFMVKMEDLVKEIIIQNDIPYYRIESRMDHQQNESGENMYSPIVRVITYFEDAVSKISDIVRAEFEIPTEPNERKKDVADSFSYKHVQIIASLKPARQEMIEYRRSVGMKFEIQVCSMLQDAWSGIEKELGYENATFPESMKRDFYRVGALLEMADLEFLKIRSQLSLKNALPQAEDIAAEAKEPTATDSEKNQVEAINKPLEATKNTEAKPEINAEKKADAPTNGVKQPTLKQPAMPGMPHPFGQPMPNFPANGYPMPANPYFPQQVPGMPTNNGNGMYPGFMPQYPMMGNYFPNYDPNLGYMQQPGQPYGPQAFMHPDPYGYMAQQAYYQQQTEMQQAAHNNEETPSAEEAAEIAPVAEHNVTNTVSHNGHAVAPTETPETPAVEAVVPVAAAQENNTSAGLPDQSEVVEKPTNGISLETMDMNVTKPDAVALKVNSVETVNGIHSDHLPEIIAGVPTNLSSITNDGENLIAAEPVENAPEATTPTNNGETVALNIDKVDTFNMNVNGMIERRTEVVVDKDEREKDIPFYEREEKPVRSGVLDENAPLTESTLKDYVATSKLVKEVDAELARRSGATLNAEVDVEGDVERLKFLKVHTLKQLHERIMDNKNDIIAFAEKWIGSDNGGSFDSGICLFYLEYLLVGKRNDPAFAVEYVLKFISDNDYSARFIIPTYNSISKQDKPIGAHLTLK